MGYLFAALSIIIVSRFLCGDWRKTFILPWVLVTVPMLSGAWLANLGLVPTLIAPWSERTHTLVIAGTMALFGGSFTLSNIRQQLVVVLNDVHWDEPMLLRVLLIITGVALVANTAQFLIAGQIPLFAADPDHARMAASRNGYIHIFSVLSGHIIPVAGLVLFTGKSLSRNTRRIITGIMIVNSLLLLLWVARGMLIYPAVTVIAMYYILNQKTFGFKKTVAVILICLVIVAGVKYMRDVMRFGFNYNATGKQTAISGFERGLLGNAAVLYLTVALNYEILNRYTATVPSLVPHSNGRLMAGNLTAYLPGSGVPYSERTMQNAILKKNEQEFTLTSTFFGIPYLDFGFPGVLLVSFGVGLLYRLVWLRMVNSGSPWTIFLYGYLVSMVLFIPYAFMYTQVSFTWFIISSFPFIFLCACRGKGSALYHRKSRVGFQQFHTD